MDSAEFSKIWTLMKRLWPAAAAKRSEQDVTIWRRGLADYDMGEVSDRIMAYAQREKYFPDLADITKGLRTVAENAEAAEAATIHTAKLLARIKGIEVPDVATAAEAMAWYRGLESSC